MRLTNLFLDFFERVAYAIGDLTERRSTTALILSLFGLINLIQVGITTVVLRGYIDNIHRNAQDRANEVVQTYLKILQSELARTHQGYTWWTELSLELERWTPNRPIPEELADSWRSGIERYIAFGVIVKGGAVALSTGVEREFWLSALSPERWEEVFAPFRQDERLETVLYLARSGRLLVVMGSPSCDDMGNPTGAALHLFGIELDADRLRTLELLAGGKFSPGSGVSLPSADGGEPFQLAFEPNIDAGPFYVLSLGSIGVQVVLNSIILAILLLTIRARTRMLQRARQTAETLRHNQDEALQSASLVQLDEEEARTYLNRIGELGRLFAELTVHSHSIIENSAMVTGRIDDTYDEIQETHHRIQSISDHIHFTSTNVKDSATQAAEMLRVIESLQRQIASFEEIANDLNQDALEGLVSIRENLNSIKAVGQSSQRVLEILQVIHDISQRTHLLAINAAIEASRAGAHGKGFNVVAAEIRTLSDTVAANTKEIEQVVTDIARRIEAAVASTQNLGKIFDAIADRSESNLQFVESIHSLMQQQTSFSSQLVAQNNLMSSIIEELENAIRQNARGLESITQSLVQLRQITDDNAHTVERLERQNDLIVQALGAIREVPERLLRQVTEIMERLKRAP